MREHANCHILYIEDDSDDALLFQRAFSRALIPCSLCCLDSVEQARGYLLGEKPYSNRKKFPLPNLIVTNLRLQGQSALSFIPWLRSEADLANIPIACLTGSDDPRKLAELAKLGVSVIRKSTVFEDALAIISKLVLP